jgi:MerR family transcriptional regulator/heat shock protein HspR
MKEYYIRICQEPGDAPSECDMVLIDELPYHRQVIRRLSVLGVIDIEDNMLPANQIDRVAKILRLRNTFGVNLSGAAIICDLLDRLEEMEKQIARLSI